MRIAFALVCLAAATIARGEENHPPVLVGGAPPRVDSITTGNEAVIDLQAEDADGDRIDLSAEGLPPGATLHVMEPDVCRCDE